MSRVYFKRRPRSRVVEAEQLTRENTPQGVDVNPLALTGKTVATMLTPNGRVFVYPGDWVVYDEEGPRVVRQALFETWYEPLSVAGRVVAAGERAVKKIWRP